MTGKGNHKGCPYGGWMGWWSANGFVSLGGRFPNRPYGNSGLDGDDGWRVRGMDSRPREKRVRGFRGKNGCRATTGSCGMDGDDVGKFAVWAGGLRECGFDGEGQPQGLPLRGDGFGGGRRTGSPVWAGGSRTAPTGKVGLDGMMGKGNHMRVAPTGDGFPPPREKRMEGRAVPEPPLRRKVGDGG